MSPTDQAKNIAIVCGSDDFTALFGVSGIDLKYNRVHYPSTELLLDSGQISEFPVVVIDVDNEGNTCFELVNRINSTVSGIRIILAGDFKSTAFPESIPKVFHFLRKPFTREKIESIVHEAFTRNFNEERRREPRIPIELPVELYYNNRFLKTSTKNLSLHGMQALWDEKDFIEEIAAMYREGRSPITACRLFLKTGNSDYDESGHLNISLILRYIIKNDNEPEVLMGFEFRDLDLDLRTRLQDVVIW